MRLMKKLTILSVGGGVLVTGAVTVVLLLFADVLTKMGTDVPGPLEAVAKMVFWPNCHTSLGSPRSEHGCSTEKPRRVDAISRFCCRVRSRAFMGLLLQRRVFHLLAPVSVCTESLARGKASLTKLSSPLIRGPQVSPRLVKVGVSST